MKATWIEHNHHLAIKHDDVIYSPTAEEVAFSFSDVVSSLPEVMKIAGNPSDYFEGLKTSIVGAPIKCSLSNGPDNTIILSLTCVKRGDVFDVDLDSGRIIDHCLSGTTVFNVTGDISGIESVLAKAKITHAGKLSMQQYLKLVEVETFAEKKFFINTVDIEALKAPSVVDVSVPETLKASLFEYQRIGFSWITNMLNETSGCILGDEMGLGKTMQIIATMLELKRNGKLPILVVAPVSLLANWKRECNKFAPSLNVHVHHGPGRIGNYQRFSDYDVIVTAYSTVVNDIYMMRMVRWSFVALDEAQNIKNPSSARTKACKSLKRDSSVAVSGTPFENHMSDIWSLVDFVQPGLLGSLNAYNENVSDDAIGGEIIEPIFSPLMIRRLVKDVAKDLPEKIISTQPIIMSEDESRMYGEYLESIKGDISEDKYDLGMLTKLRMFCTHPGLVDDSFRYVSPMEVSVKYQRFCEIMDEIVASREKVIIFTSYKKMFDIFVDDITKRYHIYVNTINGETPVNERQSIVDEFNSLSSSAALILNPRAAGTGLNITGANHVIHYNLEWNPSLEDQSSARSYRRGQDKTVFIYRLYYEDTVEQVVNERIERKRDTAKAAVVGNTGENNDRQDIIRALQLIPSIREK